MILGTQRNLNRSEYIEVYLYQELVQLVKKQNLLGVIIDDTLSWDDQVEMVCLNITRRIPLLKLLSKYVDKTSMNQYYNSYILPIIDYGCMIWGRCSSASTLRLVKLQKRAARIILNADFMTPSRLMFSELKWLTFPKRVDYHTCTMVYKALNNLAPNYICERFIMTSDIHSRNLRSVDNKMLHIPSFKTSCYGNSFTISAAKLWN